VSHQYQRGHVEAARRIRHAQPKERVKKCLKEFAGFIIKGSWVDELDGDVHWNGLERLTYCRVA